MRWAAISVAMLAAACATPAPTPVNQPITQVSIPPADLGIDGDAIALAFSGGGARAASFSLGVLQQLRDTRGADGKRLIDRVALVTAVSGGAITAAWFGRNGPDQIDGLRSAVLDKDWTDHLHRNLYWPPNWFRAIDGGMNGRDKLAGWLEQEVFGEATLADLRPHPRIIINATDLYTGSPFAFSPTYFDAICSDLGTVKLADAVAASMAVPLAFRPVVLGIYGASCPKSEPDWVDKAMADRAAPIGLRETAKSFAEYRKPDSMKYLHLVDGGVADNFGLTSLITIRKASTTPYGPFTARDAVKMRRVLFLVVNAERPYNATWPTTARGPGGLEAMAAAADVSINASKRNAYDAFDSMLKDWERDLIAFRCALPAEEARSLGAGEGWDCRNVHFDLDMVAFADLDPAMFKTLGDAPTDVSLPKPLIDQLIVGGRTVIARNALVQSLARGELD